jgi:hypothetical protein
MRGVAIALVLANLVFFAWARGWLAPAWPPPRVGEHEPGRLALQVNPERVTVLQPRAGAAGGIGSGEAAGCIEAGPFEATDLATAEAALSQAGVPAAGWVRLPDPAAPARQWLRVARPDSAWLPRLNALPPAVVGEGFKPCVAR